MRISFSWPVAASCFAGLLGTGLLDAALLVAGGAPLGPALALAVSLHGVCGIALAAALGVAVGVAIGAVPGGAAALRTNEPVDRRVTTAILSGLAGALLLAAALAGAHATFIGAMASRKLATIATFGVTLALAPLGVLGALASSRLAAAVAARLPRPSSLGASGLLLVLLSVAGVLGGIAALSRADWRVLDLGPLKALAAALVLGGAHGAFWYGSSAGRELQRRIPRRAIRVAAPAVAVALLFWAARLPETSPALTAVADHGWGLRLGLKVARAAADRDGDGYAAAFGGGDCDDRRADVFPGGDDIPGDGIDQNCEGGDAAPAASGTPARAQAAPLEPIKPAQGAFDGNILFVAIDSLRADRLGVAGYGRPPGRSLTPTLDALAKRGAYFRRVWAQAPNTPRSFPSMATSRHPSEIDWEQRTANYSAVLPSNETVFQHLARGGWKPIGIFSHFYFTPERGLARGFAEWSNDGAGTIAESNKDIASPRIVPRAIDRIKRAAAAKERFVLWTHLFEPHSSYMQHPEFPTSLRGVAGLEEKYDFEIAFVDQWVGKLLASLEEAGIADRTAVVVLADHGEAWGEHKRYFHGHDTTEEQLRVPLIIAIPGKPPVTVDDEVGLIDVAPTLLELVGLPPPQAFRGRSLLPLIDGKPLPPLPVIGEVLPATAWKEHEVMMVDGGMKVTHKITGRRWELHDLKKDPKQQRNVADDPAYRQIFDALKAKLLAFEEKRL